MTTGGFENRAVVTSSLIVGATGGEWQLRDGNPWLVARSLRAGPVSVFNGIGVLDNAGDRRSSSCEAHLSTTFVLVPRHDLQRHGVGLGGVGMAPTLRGMSGCGSWGAIIGTVCFLFVPCSYCSG